MGNNSLAIRMEFDALRTLAFGGISGTYAAVGAVLDKPMRIIQIINNTDALLTFTDDPLKVTDKFVIPATTSIIYDMSANRVDPAGMIFYPKGRTIYVKGAPTTGNLYLIALYGTNID